ncbi:VQ motif-containing protein 22 [Nicotiana tabacum]|uniref:VQ motif-containing protein 22 n=1 Tax=Nicotiana tabacum TaxID=4097 RepID=A0A1S3YBA0_TOBAC|nr:PREDICTED: VQ motif-containing protein 22-like [Nicotiana tabacum]
MGMSETMPNPTNWAQFYQHSLSGGQPQRSPLTTVFSDGRVSDATVVTTATTSIISSSTTPADHHNHGPADGRVSKPIRRRSRASRRTPTTVLNTDTTNFRAMVQQFTGGAITTPFASTQGTYLGFGSSSSNNNIVNPTTAANSGAYNIQFQQPMQQNQVPYMFSSVGRTSNLTRPNVEGNRISTLVSPSESGSSPSNENKSENNFMF